MLPINGPVPDFKQTDLAKAQIKLENFINHEIELEFSKDEEIALLYNADILSKALTAWNLSHAA